MSIFVPSQDFDEVDTHRKKSSTRRKVSMLVRIQEDEAGEEFIVNVSGILKDIMRTGLWLDCLFN